jgi:alginate O-acetyltransferase complex protein AlgI
MTLSRWIRDYVFTPLAFATRHRPKWTNVWLLVAMAAVGLWHGAQWTFVAWGVWHGVLLVANQTLLKGFFERAKTSWLRGLIAATLTFALVTIGWLLFRAESLAQVGDYLRALATMRGGVRPSTVRVNGILIIFLYLGGMVLFQLLRHRAAAFFARAGRTQTFLGALRPIGYALLIVAVIILDQEAKQFVYFQF